MHDVQLSACMVQPCSSRSPIALLQLALTGIMLLLWYGKDAGQKARWLPNCMKPNDHICSRSSECSHCRAKRSNRVLLH